MFESAWTRRLNSGASDRGYRRLKVSCDQLRSAEFVYWDNADMAVCWQPWKSSFLPLKGNGSSKKQTIRDEGCASQEGGDSRTIYSLWYLSVRLIVDKFAFLFFLNNKTSRIHAVLRKITLGGKKIPRMEQLVPSSIKSLSYKDEWDFCHFFSTSIGVHVLAVCLSVRPSDSLIRYKGLDPSTKE